VVGRGNANDRHDWTNESPAATKLTMSQSQSTDELSKFQIAIFYQITPTQLRLILAWGRNVQAFDYRLCGSLLG
jgi:hypothetical protein